MSDTLKMNAVQARIVLLNRHRDSLSNIWIDEDLTVEKTMPDVVAMLDSVVGNLQSGYQGQSQKSKKMTRK